MKNSFFCLAIISALVLSLVQCSDKEDVHYSIRLLDPNGHESYRQGETMWVTWVDNLDEPVRVLLYNEDEYVETICESAAGARCYWKIPDFLTSGDKYKVRVESTVDTSVNDASRYCFKIGTVVYSNPNYIHVIKPNGGEIWQNGNQYTVQWETNLGYPFKVLLLKGNYIVGEVSGNGITDQYWFGYIGGIEPGDDYRIAVALASDYSFNDVSDGYITILEEEEDE
ncbi:MAG: hypothetical protein ABIJ16_12135 [Bacteroidota bacterium]